VAQLNQEAPVPAPIDDDDEPIGPRRMADDERPEDAQLKTAAPIEVVAPPQVLQSNDIELRKLMLEEMKFHLEERKEVHKMFLEDRREDQKEEEIRYERELVAKEEAKKKDKESEHWMKSYWRPAMGWLYMIICAFDFIIAPMLTMAMPLFLKYLGSTTVQYAQWQSLTLQNGGLIHLAFGAILGITAYGRTQEKTAAAKVATPPTNVG
jgi:hypothetical protein